MEPASSLENSGYRSRITQQNQFMQIAYITYLTDRIVPIKAKEVPFATDISDAFGGEFEDVLEFNYLFRT